MNRQEWQKLFGELQQKQKDIMIKKNSDYSTDSDPFENFRMYGELGFAVRLSDKFSRLKRYMEKGNLSVKDETIVDTLLDASNYCLLLIGYLTEKEQKN